mgnify:CR=1 FL=1
MATTTRVQRPLGGRFDPSQRPVRVLCATQRLRPAAGAARPAGGHRPIAASTPQAGVHLSRAGQRSNVSPATAAEPGQLSGRPGKSATHVGQDGHRRPLAASQVPSVGGKPGRSLAVIRSLKMATGAEEDVVVTWLPRRVCAAAFAQVADWCGELLCEQGRLGKAAKVGGAPDQAVRADPVEAATQFVQLPVNVVCGCRARMLGSGRSSRSGTCPCRQSDDHDGGGVCSWTTRRTARRSGALLGVGHALSSSQSARCAVDATALASALMPGCVPGYALQDRIVRTVVEIVDRASRAVRRVWRSAILRSPGIAISSCTSYGGRGRSRAPADVGI